MYDFALTPEEERRQAARLAAHYARQATLALDVNTRQLFETLSECYAQKSK